VESKRQFKNTPYNFQPYQHANTPLAVDGDFGSLTRNAVKDFQTAKHIGVDGEPDNATVALRRLTMSFNLSGSLVVSCPCRFTADGLPIGLQMAVKPFEEAKVLMTPLLYLKVALVTRP